MPDENRFFPVTVPYQGPGKGQSYGPRKSGKMHHGLDFTPPGRIQADHRQYPIIAYRGGEVVQVQNGSEYGIVKIKHDDGTFARYLHTSSVMVVVTATVDAGQQIANMGRRGPGGVDVYPPHLHFELLDEKGNSFDPRPLLLDKSNNPLGTLLVHEHPKHGRPKSEGKGL
jgi:murein DD-endopeptidase MepM/ murein hydrolase activator NlpD